MISSFENPVHLVSELLISKHTSFILLVFGVFEIGLDFFHTFAQIVQSIIEVMLNHGSIKLCLSHILFHFGDLRELFVQFSNLIIDFRLHETLIDAIKLDMIIWALLVKLLSEHLVDVSSLRFNILFKLF